LVALEEQRKRVRIVKAQVCTQGGARKEKVACCQHLSCRRPAIATTHMSDIYPFLQVNEIKADRAFMRASKAFNKQASTGRWGWGVGAGFCALQGGWQHD